MPDYELTRIDSCGHELFGRAFDLLWSEFGDKNEMESRKVLDARFASRPTIHYDMVMATTDGANWAAVCDYTILERGSSDRCTLVHLSHTLVHHEHRRYGLAGILMRYAADRARKVGGTDDVLLLAESERDDGHDPMRAARLRAFERLGLRLVDPGVVDYHQPDFSDPEQEVLVAPVPMLLFLNRPFQPNAATIAGDALRDAVSRLYALYARQLRPANMRHRLLRLENYPESSAMIPLLYPTTAIR